MSSERAGVHTNGTLNREAVLDAIRACAPLNMELRPDGTDDREAAAYVEGVHTAYEAAKGALEACVVPDPRLARIEALLDEADRTVAHKGDGELQTREVRAILRGDQ